MDLQSKCKYIRERIVQIVGKNNIGHLGGSLSIVEILVAIYYGVERGCVADVILSKGHAVLTQYIVLKDLGIIDYELEDYGMITSPLQSHPSVSIPGISFPSGSLGQGVSGAAGIAYAKLHNNDPRPCVYVVLGDGELNEGQVTEAFDTISSLGLSNMKIIIDFNGWQLDGPTSHLFSIETYSKRFAAYDFRVDVCDGHDLSALTDLLSIDTDLPHVILAKTVKGKGVRSLENNNDYHGAYEKFPDDYNRIVENIAYEIY